MSKYCEFPDCEGGPYTNEEARKHKWRYHSFPASFIIGGREYIVAQSDTHYACPLPGCDKELRKRDDMQKHVIADHNGGVSIKVFDTRDTREHRRTAANDRLVLTRAVLCSAMDQDRDVSAQALVPGTPSPQGIIPTVDDGSPVDSDTVKLLPSVDYLKSNEALDALGVPSTAVQQAFLAFCSEAEIYEKPECVKLPSAGGPPIQLISPPTAGYACVMSTDCTYSVKDLPTMQRHCREKHKTEPLANVRHRACLVQRIFTGVRGSYFEISNDLLPGARPQLKDRLKETFLPGLDAPLVVPADTERERTPLVRCMAWDTFMTETRMNPAQRRAAQEIKKQHADKEHDGILTRLAETVDDHFHKAATILDGHPQKLSLSKILVHGKNIPRETRVISPPLGIIFADPPSDPHASRRSRMISYHNLAWSLVDADPTQCDASWANPIQRAIWLKALRADGNFYEATDLTPDLAKWKYFCNLVAILQALLDKDQDTDGVHPDDFERVARVHEKALSLGRPTSFNMIYEMQQYASSLAFNQTQEAKVFVDPDFKWITIGVETMHLDKLREGIQHLAQDMKSRYRALTQSNNVMTKMPDQVKDDLTNTTRGYSFISENPFFEKRHSLLLFLVEQYNLAMVDNAGRIAWNIPAVKELLRRTLRIWEPAYHLLYITTHISSRGTQFIDHQISNADRHRNLFMQGAEMFLLTGYRIVYGKDAEHLYRTYLCVGDGKRISPARFSANVQHMNYEYFECRWGLRDFRQGTITMGREFISPNESKDGCRTNGTSSSGLGSSPPQQPVRLRRAEIARATRGVDFESISDQVVKTMTGVLTSFFNDDIKTLIQHAVSASLQEHQKSNDPTGLSLSSGWAPPAMDLEFNTSDLFFQDGDRLSLPPSSAARRLPFEYHRTYYCRTPAPSPDIVPTSDQEENVSRSGNRRGQLEPYDVGQPPPATPAPMANASLPSDLGELPASSPTTATAKWKATAHAFDQPPSFTTVMNSSKGRSRAQAIEHPPPFTLAGKHGPSRTVVNASKAKARDESIKQPHSTASALSSSPAVATAVHAFDRPPSFASIIDPSTGKAKVQAVESLFTPTGKPGPSRTIAYASKGKARDVSITQAHSSVLSLSSSPAVAPMAYRKHHRPQHISEPDDDDEEAPRKLKRLRRPAPQLQTFRWRPSANQR
ncbi:uncharacterized protein EDB91DRAFT_1258099 [Suillus paluster]|uniref:uncharacterized protein n=1 Tax=Suillus paluster TaxID=48578 RepID=UPI001B867537|nr:uncharacterized protein EDB91DRAFT_1258099 [Suillus paluster]KAG1718894.1 hypothetical protein EDB91DRAFT_1258099 [Suillus paluster]